MDNFFPSSGNNKKNRKILYGPSTTTWSVPSGTTEVDIHVWGGGGGGWACRNPSQNVIGANAGGGGGYARARIAVTDSDSLSITVGGNTATSSVSIPTQTPGSPISATGGTTGSSSTPTDGASGGSGNVTLNPTLPTSYCFTASGGAGSQEYPVNPCACMAYAGGGSAGSPKGDGSPGAGGRCGSFLCGQGGGGGIGSRGLTTGSPISPNGAMCVGGLYIGGDGSDKQTLTSTQGGTMPPSPSGCQCAYRQQKVGYTADCYNCGCQCSLGTRNCCFIKTFTQQWASSPPGDSITPTAPTTECAVNVVNVDIEMSVNRTDEWFYVEDIAGGGGMGCVDAGPGGGGAGGSSQGCGGRAGFLGGGAGVTSYEETYCCCSCRSLGGCAGGSGVWCGCGACCGWTANSPGTPGVVIIYW